jgi:acetyltransferase-like isoleucine patch superfamily enzyme
MSAERVKYLSSRLWVTWQSAGVLGIISKGRRTCAVAWTRFWMRFAGLTRRGRLATRLATWCTPPYKGRAYLARMNPQGFISPSTIIHHSDLHLGAKVFIGDNVIIYQASIDGGPVKLGDCVHLHRDIIIEVGFGGSLTIGANTAIQPRCQFSAYEAPIRIGCDVQIAPYCAFYPYDHGFAPGELIRKEPFQTKGGIVIEDDVWLGVGVIVLDGVRIGKGAVIGAGAVVTRDVPDGAIAMGVPARVVKMRHDLVSTGGVRCEDQLEIIDEQKDLS